jgi:uncharacterized membrane protein
MNLKKTSLYTIGFFFVITSIAHFFLDDFLVSIIPPILPYKRILIYVSGFYEFLIGMLMLLSPFKKLAAWGMIALLVAVFPVHIYMQFNQENFPQFSEIFFPLRITLQLVFIYWAYIHTKD